MIPNFNRLQHLPWLSWSKTAIAVAQTGKLPNYVPLLTEANPQTLALAIADQTATINYWGNINTPFPLMSVIKPFLLLYHLNFKNEEWVFHQVGKQASNLPFNSLLQLQEDQGFPRNPMINSGAIRLAANLPADNAKDRCLALQNWLNQGLEHPCYLDEQMLASVQSVANTKNQALAQTMAHFGYLENWVLALETYNYICCLSGTVLTLAELGKLLIQSATSVTTEISHKNSQIVQQLMTSCGLYEASSDFTQKIAFPSKSGVSGILLSLIPEQAAIAIYSPPLDGQGNSCAGLYLIQEIAQLIT